MAIVKYTHAYGGGGAAEVFVDEDLKGKHREHCLCHKCEKFKPGSADNCKIASAVFGNCVKFSIVTPVWECPEYRQKQ
jgi:hypothetical protein